MQLCSQVGCERVLIKIVSDYELNDKHIYKSYLRIKSAVYMMSTAGAYWFSESLYLHFYIDLKNGLDIERLGTCKGLKGLTSSSFSANW